MIPLRPPTPFNLAEDKIMDLASHEVADLDFADLYPLVDSVLSTTDAETQDIRLAWAEHVDDFVDKVLDDNPYAPDQVARVLWSEINALVAETVPQVETEAHRLLNTFTGFERKRLIKEARWAAADEILYRICDGRS